MTKSYYPTFVTVFNPVLLKHAQLRFRAYAMPINQLEPPEPLCGKCGKPLTPQTAKIHPEYFLHDNCLPAEQQNPSTNPARPPRPHRQAPPTTRTTRQMYNPKTGHTGEGTFWTNGRLEIHRYCDSVFELRCNGTPIMPTGTFEQINAYLWAEFAVLPTIPPLILP